MRPLYLLLRILLPYVMTIFYRKSKTLNSQKKLNAQTIFVCNHPSAFIDPLVAGNFQLPVLYFVTRGDIFKTWLKPVTWASHMVPIFRKAQDGADSHEKNKDSFRYLRKVLMRKKSLILFGEGYTDDVFIRSLKPLKKGPARIGFDTMVECDWNEDIKIQTISINYSHPKYFRSDVVVAFGDCISLKDYKTAYSSNPNVAITKLTREIEESMQEQLTYVKNTELAPFVENILILSRKGMNHFHYDRSYSLQERYENSKRIATKINNEYDENDTAWTNLHASVTAYFKSLSTKKLNENWVHQYSLTQSNPTLPAILGFILGLPLIILGLVHNLIPYLLIKRFVENTFKRDVFWSGVKLLVGAVFGVLFNLVFIFLFYKYIYASYLLATAYFIIAPVVSGIFTYQQIKKFKDALACRKANKAHIKEMAAERSKLTQELKGLDLL